MTTSAGSRLAALYLKSEVPVTGCSIRWIRDRRFPIFSDVRPEAYVAGVACDITDRKRSQQALIESHVRFVTVLDSLDADIERMRGIKAVFDPHNIMNPGKLLG